MELFDLLKAMVERNASDLFLSVGAAPYLKVEGVATAVAGRPMKAGEVKELAYSMMNERQRREFEQNLECNLAISVQGIGRFRMNVFLQKGEVGVVARYIRSAIPSLSALGLPKVIEDLALSKRGLILIVGAAGSGKSTTLASMLDFRNEQRAGHILTIEDPIEFVHSHKRSIFDQREVGIDTLTFGDALRNAMRESPDVIAIGEIRDRETMQHCIAYAETGHLCLSTLHSNNANQALERIVNFFPERPQVYLDLSLNLKAVVSQRLVPGLQGSQVPAIEVMLTSSLIADLIHRGRVDEIKEAMARSNEAGMRTFDQSLYDLYMERRISLEEALRNADSRTDLALRVRLSSGQTAAEMAHDRA